MQAVAASQEGKGRERKCTGVVIVDRKLEHAERPEVWIVDYGLQLRPLLKCTDATQCFVRWESTPFVRMMTPCIEKIEGGAEKVTCVPALIHLFFFKSWILSCASIKDSAKTDGTYSTKRSGWEWEGLQYIGLLYVVSKVLEITDIKVSAPGQANLSRLIFVHGFVKGTVKRLLVDLPQQRVAVRPRVTRIAGNKLVILGIAFGRELLVSEQLGLSGGTQANTQAITKANRLGRQLDIVPPGGVSPKLQFSDLLRLCTMRKPVVSLLNRQFVFASIGRTGS